MLFCSDVVCFRCRAAALTAYDGFQEVVCGEPSLGVRSAEFTRLRLLPARWLFLKLILKTVGSNRRRALVAALAMREMLI
jgi:hypothetical protein